MGAHWSTNPTQGASFSLRQRPCLRNTNSWGKKSWSQLLTYPPICTDEDTSTHSHTHICTHTYNYRKPRGSNAFGTISAVSVYLSLLSPVLGTNKRLGIYFWFFISFRLANKVKSFITAFSHVRVITLIALLHCPPPHPSLVESLSSLSPCFCFHVTHFPSSCLSHPLLRSFPPLMISFRTIIWPTYMYKHMHDICFFTKNWHIIHGRKERGI